jgi:hypothetical protein
MGNFMMQLNIKKYNMMNIHFMKEICKEVLGMERAK